MLAPVTGITGWPDVGQISAGGPLRPYIRGMRDTALCPAWFLATLFLAAPLRGLAAQTDSSAPVCSTLSQAQPDSMVPVDTEATADHLPFLTEGPRDADRRAIIAHFVVTADGRVDTSTVRVEHTTDEHWINDLRRELADATYHPARVRGCPVPRWATFAVWSEH